MGSYGKDGELNYDDLTKNLGQIGITELPDTASYPLEVTLDGVSATIEANGEVNFTTSGGYTPNRRYYNFARWKNNESRRLCRL